MRGKTVTGEWAVGRRSEDGVVRDCSPRRCLGTGTVNQSDDRLTEGGTRGDGDPPEGLPGTTDGCPSPVSG